MPALDTLFASIESYQNMSVPYLRFSKINKVMRLIMLSPDDKVPRDPEFKFRERARALVNQWRGMLDAWETSLAQTNGNMGGGGDCMEVVEEEDEDAWIALAMARMGLDVGAM